QIEVDRIDVLGFRIDRQHLAGFVSRVAAAAFSVDEEILVQVFAKGRQPGTAMDRTADENADDGKNAAKQQRSACQTRENELDARGHQKFLELPGRSDAAAATILRLHIQRQASILFRVRIDVEEKRIEVADLGKGARGGRDMHLGRPAEIDLI